MTLISANIDEKILKEFRHVIFTSSGLKKGDFKKSLEAAMLDHIIKNSKGAMLDYIIKHNPESASKFRMIPNEKTQDQLSKTIVGLAIELTLLEIGKLELEKVIECLNNAWGCTLYDCYENPKYLYKILKDLYGNSYNCILDSIRKKMGTLSSYSPIKDFIVQLEEQ